MKRILVPFCMLISISLYSQNEIEAYVNKNTNTISSINPDDTNYTDLTTIGNAIGDARIIMLGEQDHGDAPTFAAKTRLINYLHAQKGFDVVLFESDFFSGTYGFQNLKNSPEAFSGYYKGSIFFYWTLCDACSSFFTKSVPESFATKNPFILGGFDNQVYLKYSTANLTKSIDSIAKLNSLDIVKQEADYKNILSLIDVLSNALIVLSKKKQFYEDGIIALQPLKSQLEQKLGKESFWPLLIDNLIATCNQIANKDNDFVKSCNFRDKQMAENLKWLCNVKYPDKKIIVWAANYHVSKFTGHFNKQSLNESSSMATEFTKDENLNKQTYIIGFDSYEGEAGRIGTKTFTIEKPDKKGFENWIDNAVNYGFVDFKKFNALNPEYTKEFPLKSSVRSDGVHRSNNAQWNKMFDAIFFIRKMYPCKVQY